MQLKIISFSPCLKPTPIHTGLLSVTRWVFVLITINVTTVCLLDLFYTSLYTCSQTLQRPHLLTEHKHTFPRQQRLVMFERCLGHAGCYGFPTLVFLRETGHDGVALTFWERHTHNFVDLGTWSQNHEWLSYMSKVATFLIRIVFEARGGGCVDHSPLWNISHHSQTLTQPNLPSLSTWNINRCWIGYIMADMTQIKSAMHTTK